MANESITSLEDAKQQLTKLMNCLDKTHREHLLSFAILEWMTVKVGDDESEEGSYTAEDTMDDPVATLNSIAKEIRQKVPVDSILPSETLMLSQNDEASQSHPNITVDGFLYSDDEREELERKGKIKSTYCLDCGSRNTAPLKIVSHSTSREDLYNIFNNMLPTLDEKTILDVGSRLGAVLYGAYVYTDAKKIIGVEMNKEFCDLQNEIVRKFKMGNRIEILNKRVEDAVEQVRSADVIILNNVFEFDPTETQVEIWRFLRENVKKGAYIVSRPDMETTLATLDTGIIIDQWLEVLDEPTSSKSKNLFDLGPDDRDNGSTKMACYVVL